MVARASEGNPWIFREIRHFLETGEESIPPSADEVREMILNHAERLIALKGEHLAMLEMRKHAAWYLKGMPGAASMRREITAIRTFEDLIKTVNAQASDEGAQ